MRTNLMLIINLLLCTPILAQPVYHIPFASSKNSVELTVVNGSWISVSSVGIKAVDVPSWMHIQQQKQEIPQMKPQEQTPVSFTFSVDKTAPVNKEQNIQFNISAPSGETWTKQIKILIEAPERFELFQNYPNPFNPSTVISYTLPVGRNAISTYNVTLKVYNVLGQEIATLVNETQEAGYKSVEFNGNNFPSGIYFYKLSAGTFLQVGKMMLVK